MCDRLRSRVCTGVAAMSVLVVALVGEWLACAAFACVSVLVGERRMGSVHAYLSSGLHASVP